MTDSLTSVPPGLQATMVARQALDRWLEQPGEADKIPGFVSACVHQAPKKGEDFRLRFPEIAALLSHPATHALTRTELMADFERKDGGIWRPAIDAIAAKAQRDSLDIVCLLAAYTVLEQVFMDLCGKSNSTDPAKSGRSWPICDRP